MLQKHLDSCISIVPSDPSLKLFLTLMPAEDLWLAKSFVHLADKTIYLYPYIVSCPHLKWYFLWAKSCLVALCLCNTSDNRVLIHGGSSSAFNVKNNKSINKCLRMTASCGAGAVCKNSVSLGQLVSLPGECRCN